MVNVWGPLTTTPGRRADFEGRRWSGPPRLRYDRLVIAIAVVVAIIVVVIGDQMRLQVVVVGTRLGLLVNDHVLSLSLVVAVVYLGPAAMARLGHRGPWFLSTPLRHLRENVHRFKHMVARIRVRQIGSWRRSHIVVPVCHVFVLVLVRVTEYRWVGGGNVVRCRFVWRKPTRRNFRKGTRLPIWGKRLLSRGAYRRGRQP